MKQSKLLFCAVLLSCIPISAAFAEDSVSIVQTEKEINLESIALEKQDKNSVFFNLFRHTAVKGAEAKSSEASSVVEEKKNPETVESLENKDKNVVLLDSVKTAVPQSNETPTQAESLTSQNNILPVYDLKGGVEQSPEIKLESGLPAITKESFLGSWWNGNYATGEWLGVRPKLEEHGLKIDSSIMQSSFGKGHGGMTDARAVKGYMLYNLGVTLDTEKMGLWKGGTVYMLYQRKKGMGLSSEFMGDYQVIDGYDFHETNQLSEAWYQQKLFNDKLRIKFGKQDALTDFSSLVKGFDFMNTSFSLIPTVALPTYPDQKLGFMAEISPKQWLSLRNGTYYKNSGAFNISEIEVKSNIRNLPGRYLTGYWAQAADRPVVAGLDAYGDPITRTFFRNYGGYAAFEQMLYRENKKDENNQQGLTVIGQVGFTPSNRNDVNRYFGAGLHYKGPIPKRDNDILGLGVASANFSTRLADIDERAKQETAIECFYRVQINPWLYVQPDAQFIMNPGGNNPNALAIGLRTVVKF